MVSKEINNNCSIKVSDCSIEVLTALSEYLNLVLSDNGQVKTYLQKGFLKR